MPDIRDRILELRRVKASDLIPNVKNWRKHPPLQQAAMRGILAEIGYADALLARETSDGIQLIDGHLRAEITPDMEVPVLIVDLDEAEADKLLLTFDPLAGMAEADTERLEALLASVQTDDDAVRKMLNALRDEHLVTFVAGKTDPDDVPPIPAEPITKIGDLWLLGTHRLLCGDSTQSEDVARLMGDDKAEMVWTDPPYGVAVGDKNKWLNSIARSNRVEKNLVNDTLDEPALMAMLRASFDLAMASCTAGAATYPLRPGAQGAGHLAPDDPMGEEQRHLCANGRRLSLAVRANLLRLDA